MTVCRLHICSAVVVFISLHFCFVSVSVALRLLMTQLVGVAVMVAVLCFVYPMWGDLRS